MNEEQNEICREIMSILYKRPISKMFDSFQIDCYQKTPTVPLTMQLIEEKLDRGLYPTAESWVTDLRTLFSNAMLVNAPISLKYAAAKQLSEDLNDLLSVLSPTISPHTIDFQITEFQFRQLLQRSSKVGKFMIEAPNKQHPVSYSIKSLSKFSIVDKIRLINSPSALLNICSFIHQIQPECIIIEKAVSRIRFSLLEPGNKAKVDEYINNIILKCAKGEMDAFQRVFGSHISPLNSSIE